MKDCCIGMNQNNKKSPLSNRRSVKLKIGGDYLKLLDKKVKLIFKETDTGLNTKKNSQEIFKDLDHLRWPVEVDCLFMKERIQIGNFSRESLLSVYQDFHSKVFTKNLIWVLASPA
jgi:hypothetical protein